MGRLPGSGNARGASLPGGLATHRLLTLAGGCPWERLTCPQWAAEAEAGGLAGGGGAGAQGGRALQTQHLQVAAGSAFSPDHVSFREEAGDLIRFLPGEGAGPRCLGNVGGLRGVGGGLGNAAAGPPSRVAAPCLGERRSPAGQTSPGGCEGPPQPGRVERAGPWGRGEGAAPGGSGGRTQPANQPGLPKP